MSKVNIVRIEAENSKFGTKKILWDDQGNKYSISSKRQWMYEEAQTEGQYDIEMGEYMGKPSVQKIKFIAPFNAAGTASAQPAQKPQQGAVLADRIAFDKDKQKDIMIEFYVGIAKDVLIATLGDKAEITPDQLFLYATSLMRRHILAKACELTPSEEAKPETASASEEDAPF